LIDYGVGNINAFVNVYKRVDVPIKIATTKEDLIEHKTYSSVRTF
jgi:glutamine amidotransferase